MTDGQQENRGGVRVLLVDDQRIIAEALHRLLAEESDIALKWEGDAAQALQTAIDWQPTVILQDLVMPGADGLDLVRTFRAHAQTCHIPVVMLSMREDPRVKAQCFEAGASDYLIKLPDRLELHARLRYHSAACRSRQERDAALAALRESERALTEANVRLQRLADVDGLTGIANRRRFDDALQGEWLRGMRNQRAMSLLLCDVDHFKQFNDLYGHGAGDECLKQVAAALCTNLRRPADMCARYGGEEFALILPETELPGAVMVAESCREAVQALGIAHSGAPYGLVTLSVGVACVVPDKQDSAAALLAAADRALYAAKGDGRNRVNT